RDQEVDGKVVRQHREPLGRDLQGMHRGEDGRRLAYLTLLAEEAVLEVAISAALADASPVAPDRHRAAYDEVDRSHLARRDRTTVVAGAVDAGRERRPLAEPLRVDLDEALLGPEARHRHVENLALGEREPADRE